MDLPAPLLQEYSSLPFLFHKKGGQKMPKTKFQEVIFTLLMVMVMVYAMVVYNIAFDQGDAVGAVGRQISQNTRGGSRFDAVQVDGGPRFVARNVQQRIIGPWRG